jgi:hypothetical protein
MTGRGTRRGTWAVAACVLLLATACAQPAGGATGSPTTAPPADPDQLVLRIQRVGGFLPVGVTEASVPVVSVYADGRVITEGPVPAIYPGPATPNVQVRRIGAGDVRALVDRALAAGVRDTADLGRPGVVDAATTRFTVNTGGGTVVREVYALGDDGRTAADGSAPGNPDRGPRPTAEQVAARAQLLRLSDALTDLEGTLGADAVGNSQPFAAEAVAAVVTSWPQRADDLPQSPRAWPGPDLPGEQLGGQAGLTCVSARGSAATALLDAARQANRLTPWTSADGRAWAVTFRPLLPDESGCADLTG